MSGLGSTSPRPSPSDDKPELFRQGLIPQEQAVSPYEQYFQPTAAQPFQQNLYNFTQQQPQLQQQSHLHLQPSAFTPIQDVNQGYMQQPNRQQSSIHQQYPFNQNQSTSSSQQLSNQLLSATQPRLNLGAHSPIPSAQPQQYAPAFQPQVQTQAALMAQQQAAQLGVGTLSPSQAQMYQQQMALQHQAQHLKKNRRAHTTGMVDVRRDGSSAVLIPGQNMTLGPGGMTIGAVGPAVVTSLGTIVSGGQTLLSNPFLQQPLAREHF